MRRWAAAHWWLGALHAARACVLASSHQTCERTRARPRRAVISVGHGAQALSRDHKPNRADEQQRIEGAGGAVVWAGTWRVGGVLAVSRSFGNRMMKQVGLVSRAVGRAQCTGCAGSGRCARQRRRATAGRLPRRACACVC